ncbi:MAG: hypothetical protein ACFHHU_00410 [Porticoccaceae bacterium]
MSENYRPRIEIEAVLPKDAGELAMRVFKAIDDMEELPTDWEHCDYPADLVPYLSAMQEAPDNMECIPQYHENGTFTVVCENQYREYDVTLVMHAIMKAYNVEGVARIEYSDHTSGGIYVASAKGHDGMATSMMMQACEERLLGKKIGIVDVSPAQHTAILAGLRILQSALAAGEVPQVLYELAEPDTSGSIVTSDDIETLIEQHIN